MPSRFSVPFHLWSPSATLLFGTHPPPLTPLIQPRHLLKAGTFFSPNFAPAEWMTSASRRNIKRRGAGGGRSAGKGDLLRCESAGLNPQLQPVVLGPRALPLCCFRFSWRSAWRTCSAFFFFFFSFSLESALYVTCFFFFYYYYLKHPLFRDCWSLETNFRAYFEEFAAFRWLCTGCYVN